MAQRESALRAWGTPWLVVHPVWRYSAPSPSGSPVFSPSPYSLPQFQVQKMSHGLVVLKMNMELCGTIALPVSLFSFFRFFFSTSSSSSLVSASFKGLASPSVLLLTAGKREPLPGLEPRTAPWGAPTTSPPSFCFASLCCYRESNQKERKDTSCWDEANKRGLNKASICSTVKLIPPLKAAHLASKDAVKGFEQQRGRG